MVPLDAGLGSLGNWKQLRFVATDAKTMMDRLSAVGFGPFKVYHVDSGDWEGSPTGAPPPSARRSRSAWRAGPGTWKSSCPSPAAAEPSTASSWPISPPAASTTSARTWPRTNTPRPTGTWRDSAIRKSRAGRSWASTATAVSTTRGGCTNRAHSGAPGNAGGRWPTTARVEVLSVGNR